MTLKQFEKKFEELLYEYTPTITQLVNMYYSIKNKKRNYIKREGEDTLEK